ncbi:MAG: Cof-type HAD-IIB family hydrolase [Chloroflexi bacterium]|nr:Cof-type HAD-IIB family hydrolase [Chloroflexota bacterium]
MSRPYYRMKKKAIPSPGTYKLVAVDVDGSLVGCDLLITARVKERVRQARALGVEFTLATGRAHFSAVRFAKELGLTLPLITYGGGMISDAGNGRIYFRKALSPDLARGAYEILTEIGLQVHIHDDKGVHAAEERDEIRLYNSLTSNPVIITDIEPVLDAGPMKLLAVSDDMDLLKKGELILEEKLPGLVSIARSLPNFVEVVDVDVSKGTALEWLGGHLGIKREEIIAFGDSYNDISMLEYAGLGIAAEDAPDEVKEYADIVGPGPDNEGTAWIIENFVLPQLETGD